MINKSKLTRLVPLMLPPLVMNMKKKSKRTAIAALALGLACLSLNRPSIAQGLNVSLSQFIGSTFYDIQAPFAGINTLSNVCIHTTGDAMSDCALTLSEVQFRNSNGKAAHAVFLVSRYPKKWKLEDSVDMPDEIPGGFEFEHCISNKYRSKQIVAYGVWKSRIPPKVGGYMTKVLKAWIVDIDRVKFVEIPIVGVICELNEDRD